MSMDAVAALRVTLDEAKKSLKPAEGEPGTWLSGADGVAFRLRAFDDGILVHLGLSLREAEPETVALTLRERLGDLLDAHDDERGILIFPERVRPKAKSYAEIVEELGDLGEWVSLVEASEAPSGAAPATGLEDLMSQMMGGDAAQMQGLWQQAQRMMADPAMQEQLMAAASQMMGGQKPGAMPGLGGLDLGALAAQAQELLEKDPELVRRLQEQLEEEDDEDEEG